jgi:hypothetical protein
MNHATDHFAEAQPRKVTESFNLTNQIINLQNSVSVRTYYIDI